MYSLFFLLLVFQLGTTEELQDRTFVTTSEIFIIIRNLVMSILAKTPLAILNNILYIEPEAYMNTPQLIEYYGYSVETHSVVTKDGYILQMHRIPHGRQQSGSGRIPVLVQHGFCGSSGNFAANLPKQSLAFLLADSGFDVWLGNLRGNSYSSAHKTLDPNNYEFWQFSFDQMAEYDMPAMVDHILQKTGFKSVYYIGHSMGGSMAFTAATYHPELNKKIKAAFGLAPMADESKDDKNSPKSIAQFAPLFKLFLLDIFHVHKIDVALVNRILGPAIGLFFPFILTSTYSIFGVSSTQLNISRSAIYAKQLSDQQSMHVLVHILQLINTNEFRHYDWGREKNLELYGQETATLYDFSKVTIPGYLIYGENDLACSQSNVQFLFDNLPNANGIYASGHNFNHLDFLLTADPKFLYDKLIQGILEFEKQNNTNANLDKCLEP